MHSGVEILLATYNGERFLKEQIESIFAQTHSDWKLLLRDDESTDGTLGIIHQYLRSYPDKITLLNDHGHLGAVQSFSRLLEHATSDYIMFCDQDDVWLPDKIAKFSRMMTSLEETHGTKKPLLVHSDLRIIASDMTPLAESMWKLQKINPNGGSRLNKLLQKNVVTGNSTMINRSLKNLALPFPETAIMHDWWLALVTAAFGTFGIISEPTLLYRQHKDNAIGASTASYSTELASIIRPSDRKTVKDGSQMMLQKYIAQAQSFAERYGPGLTDSQIELLDVFINLTSYNVLTRKYYIVKHQLFYNNPLITLGMLLFKWK